MILLNQMADIVRGSRVPVAEDEFNRAFRLAVKTVLADIATLVPRYAASEPDWQSGNPTLPYEDYFFQAILHGVMYYMKLFTRWAAVGEAADATLYRMELWRALARKLDDEKNMMAAGSGGVEP